MVNIWEIQVNLNVRYVVVKFVAGVEFIYSLLAVKVSFPGQKPTFNYRHGGIRTSRRFSVRRKNRCQLNTTPNETSDFSKFCNSWNNKKRFCRI